MAKHTPGPWEVTQNHGAYVKRPELGMFRIESAGDPDTLAVAVVITDCPKLNDTGMAEANARLIAAAPNLLAAVRDQIAWLERLLQTLEHRDVTDPRGDIVNGFAGAFVPDWDMRQKLESLKGDLANAGGDS